MGKYLLVILGLQLLSFATAAQYKIIGTVSDSLMHPIAGVAVQKVGSSIGTVSDSTGMFELQVDQPGAYLLQFSHIQYLPVQKQVQASQNITRISQVMQAKINMLDEVAVTSNAALKAINSVTLKGVSISNIATPFNDISNVLASLPSVMSNNELSTSYAVRGGNYDENIVKVNGIRVYRPFLVRSGQQEGLSFINTDLIAAVQFSAGGWDATDGSKMSSVLRATYKHPDHWGGGIRLSLLGLSAYASGASGPSSFLMGARYKRSRYILNTLDVNAAYDPKFADIQGIWNYRFSNNTTLEVLGAFASNRYHVIPQNGQISFGTFNQELRFEVGFDGQEQMNYNTWQGAAKLNTRLAKNVTVNFIGSYMRTFEQEHGEVEGGYRLCDVDKNLGSDTFDECIQIRGIGSLYSYARNALDAQIIDGEANAILQLEGPGEVDFGMRYSNRIIYSNRNEYSFTDSVGYTNITEVQSANVTIKATEINVYGQYFYNGDKFKYTAGAFVSQNSLTAKWYFSPRVLAKFIPKSNSNVSFKLGTGLYRQQPIYRELLTPSGALTTEPRTQSAWHLVLGNNYRFTWWNRTFNLSTQAYYKYLWHLVPYQFDNIRVVYYPQYSARGYATGFETRLSGEFIKGTESWFSLGLLSTKELIAPIDYQLVRRPTDQRFKVGAVFEDHIPNDPTLRVNLSLQYGSGLPIGPPGDLAQRNLFTADAYTRVDILFSKLFMMKAPHWEYLKFGLGIYNILGNKNAVTYTWITDFGGQKFAVPNNLTGRLFNLTIESKF